ncbi:MAG: ElyC/SanA/YdcF family protein [Minisyncoccota bacterium]
MNIFVLYHFGGSKVALSYDALLRTEAAVLFVSRYQPSSLYFVGGTFADDIPSGATLMKRYADRMAPSSILTDCLPSQSTRSNIQQIMRFYDEDGGVIITSLYHIPRVVWLLGKYASQYRVCAAEDIIIQYGNKEQQYIVRQYIFSVRYRIKSLIEKILFVCMQNLWFTHILERMRQWRYRE